MKSQIKRTIAILLLVCFVVSLTATAVSASKYPSKIKHHPSKRSAVVTDDASQCFDQPIPDCPNGGQAVCVDRRMVCPDGTPSSPGVPTGGIPSSSGGGTTGGGQPDDTNPCKEPQPLCYRGIPAKCVNGEWKCTSPGPLLVKNGCDLWDQPGCSSGSHAVCDCFGRWHCQRDSIQPK